MSPLEARERYEAWLRAGRYAGMAWLASESHRARRADPARILPGLRSVVCVALCHSPDSDAERDRRLGRIARYAAGYDYHEVMAERLDALSAFVTELLPGARSLGYSDTGAILERGWAERAGLGWIGKHSGLLSQTLGSWFLLGELLIDQPLEPDLPLVREHCGTCTRCIGACPTGAIFAPYQLDARLCISYWTIEHRGSIPREMRSRIGDWIFGCDICQEVCPWNRFAPQAREARLHGRAYEAWTLERFLEMDDATFRSCFEGSPIRRARRDGFLRNVCVALGNRRDGEAVPALLRALAFDPEAVVREHAAWALGEIGDGMAAGDAARTTIAGGLARASHDPAPQVRDEACRAIETLNPA